MARASVQQVQESSVLQVVTLVLNASILVLHSDSTEPSMVTSPQDAPMLVLQFFRVCPIAEADLGQIKVISLTQVNVS